MKKNNVLKRTILGLMALVMVLTSVAPVFAAEDDTSRFEKTEYENQYGKNGKIPTTHITGYDECYKLSNEYSLHSNVVLYLFTENLYYIDSSDFVYEFCGTMNAKNEYCDMGFLFDLELLGNKKISNTKELSSGRKVNLRQYQFSIYPGFYNFYNSGNNGFWSSINNENVILKTLTPNFNLSQEESYLNGKDAWVEIRESSTVTRVYVMLGTPEWYNTATKEVADWAMEIERSIYQSEIEHSESNEEVEVDVDEEKLEEALKDKDVEVEEETDEEELSSKPIFIESTPQEPEAPTKDYSVFIKYGIIIFVLIIVGVVGVNVYKKITARKY